MIMDDELFDWELLHGSDTESTDSITSEKKSGSSSVIDDGIILSDHFSADKLIDNSADLSQLGVIETGESSRVDYGTEPPNSEAFLVDLGFHQSNANLSSDGCIKNELGVYDSVTGDGEVRLSAFAAADVTETNGGTLSLHDDKSLCFSESEDLEFGKGSGGEEPIKDSSKSWSDGSDSGGNELVSGDSGSVDGEEEIVSESIVASTEAIGGIGEDAVQVEAANSGDNSKSREIVWWKMPFLLLKYCTYRIGPVWSVSMAAAVMGLVLLGRRLYNMKKKAQKFNLKVTIDDKKVSRVMSQAARLNEAFTEVRRVPVIRPAFPDPGAWPVLSLR